ncbi:MAG TPA: SH3 domain-containing C40 family peptidase [Gemmatirosa sp.]
MPHAAPEATVALVRVPVAPVHADPRVSSAQTTQATFGHVLVLRERHGDWYDAQTTPDGYRGWIHAGYLIEVDDPAPAVAQAASDRAAAAAAAQGLRVSLGCTARAGGRTLRLPLGAWIGPDVDLLEGDALPMDEMPARFPRDGEAVARSAARYFGSTSYQWGGLTPWGADCSGLVQTVFALHGVELPRDASQQATVGLDAGREFALHAPGDLLFFSDRDDGRVTHVGLAAGGGRMMHLALGRGGFADEDLAGDDDPYVAALRRRFVGARRVLGPG